MTARDEARRILDSAADRLLRERLAKPVSQRKEKPMAEATTRSQKEVERELERIERFRKIAGHRANRALDYIEGLLKTSERSRYSYTEEQATEIITKLHQAVDQLAAAYAGQRKSRVRVEL